MQSAVIDETMIIASLQAQIQTDLVSLNFDIYLLIRAGGGRRKLFKFGWNELLLHKCL